MPTPATNRPPSPTRTPLRIAISGDYEIVVEGLRSMLRPYADRVVLVGDEGRSSSGAAPDLVLHEVSAPAPVIAPARAVVYTWNVEAALADDVDSSRLVSKTLSAADLVDALERIHDGQHVVAGRSTPTESWPGSDLGLSERESEVLGYIATGISNNEVAELAFLSINTVKSYVRSTYRKIGVDTRSQAVLWAVAHGFRP